MKKTVLILCLFFIIGLPLLHAEWLHNGVPVTDSPYAKTVGEFGAMLIFTDKPDELFSAWNKDTLTQPSYCQGILLDQVCRGSRFWNEQNHSVES